MISCASRIFNIKPQRLTALFCPEACFSSPETFRAQFGWHNSLCIFKTKASRGTKLCSYLYFYSLYNIWPALISRPEFYEWLFGPEKFRDFRETRPCSVTQFWASSALSDITLSPQACNGDWVSWLKRGTSLADFSTFIKTSKGR